jgi:hypothetical protein
VKLKLHANLESKPEQPSGQLDGVHGAEHRTQQHREVSVEVVPPDRVKGPVKVSPRRDDELDLIGWLEKAEVVPVIVLTLSTIGAFQIHDDVDARRQA